MSKRRIEMEILDPVETRVKKGHHKEVAQYINYEYAYWVKGRFKKVQRKGVGVAWTRKNLKGHYYFNTGLLQRVVKGLRHDNIPYQVTGFKNLFFSPPPPIPSLPHIRFRPDQLQVLEKVRRKRRGLIIAPTGSGKTAIAAAIFKMFAREGKGLFLAHTNDLVRQAEAEFRRFGFGSVGVCGGGRWDVGEHIVISTVQTFVRRANFSKLSSEFQCLLVDEAHHARSESYQTTLRQLLAPHRFGVTATMPDKMEDVLKVEALIGGVIARVTLDEAREEGVLAKPTLRFLRPSSSSHLSQIRSYPESYRQGIIENEARNRAVVETVREMNRKNKSCLVMVVNKRHGRILGEMGGWEFVQGSTDTEKRVELKKALERKEILTLVSSVVFREGVNIRSLDCVVLAGGGKGELPLLQSIGRGLRKAEGKVECVIVDFLDLTNKHLLFQLGHRLEVYSKLGWL